MDFVDKVVYFNKVSGATDDFNPRMVALYTGLQIEELREKIEAISANSSYEDFKELYNLAKALYEYEIRFKTGVYDAAVKNANRESMLDADVDLAVVAIGGATHLGVDVRGACHHVADNNLDKIMTIDGNPEIIKDENGKVMKPEGYKSVDLSPYIKRT